MTVPSKLEEVSASSIEKDRSSRWQLNVKSLDDAVKYIYETGEFSDCTITVNNRKTFNGHRLILGAKSLKFRDLLLGKKQTKLAISCSEVGFTLFFRYTYLNEMGETDTGSILDAYRVAIEFQHEDMIAECDKLIREWEVTVSNVFPTLNGALDVEFLKRRCLQFIKENSQIVLQSEDFKKDSTRSELAPKALLVILEENCFSNIPILDLVNAVCNWGLSHFPKMEDCKRLREFLMENSILGKLNIHLLKVDELLKWMKSYKNLITPEDFFLLQMHAFDPEENKALPAWCEVANA